MIAIRPKCGMKGKLPDHFIGHWITNTNFSPRNSTAKSFYVDYNCSDAFEVPQVTESVISASSKNELTPIFHG